MDPARLTQLVLGHWPARAVSAAAEAGVLDVLRHGPLAPAEVAERLDLRAPSLALLLEALAGLGVLAAEDGRYRLVADVPADLLALADGEAYAAWADLPAALRTGRRDGPSMFEALAADPAVLDRYLAAMATATRPAHDALLDRLDLTGVATVLDVGGGDGGLAARLAERGPEVTVLELPAVAARVDRPGVRVVPGDLRRDELPPADLVVLSMVLLDWEPAVKVDLLRRCRAAARQRLVIVDRLGRPPAPASTFEALRALHLLVTTGDAFHYDAGDLARWLDQAGFRPPAVEDLGGGFALATAVPR